MEKVSVIIPVFRESTFLENTLLRLRRDRYPNKEFVVVIDEPTEKSLKTAKRFTGKVTFILNKERMGKSYALNVASKKSTGDLFFFLDSDSRISGNSNDTVEKIVSAMKDNDIAEIKTDVIKKSYISRMVGFDFLVTNFASYMFSRKVGRKPIIGGIAIVIRKSAFKKLGGFKKEVTEDVDLGWRAFKSGMRYVFVDDFSVVTECPSNLNDWIVQRNRWALGTSKLLAEKPVEKFLGFVKTGRAGIPFSLITFPPVILAIFGLFLPDSLFSSIVGIKGLFLYIAGFFLSMISTLSVAKFMKYSVKKLDFIAYYFLYSPIMFALYGYWLFASKFKRTVALDWKF